MTQLIDYTEINDLLFAAKRDAFSKEADNCETIEFTDDSGATYLARFYKHGDKSANIIFFPALDTPLDSYEQMAAAYNAQGINILLLSYKGDNEEAHKTSLSSFYEEGRQLYNQSLAWLDGNGMEGAKIVMGQSLGTLLAIDVVADNPDPLKALLLESSVCKTGAYLQSRGLEIDSIEDIEERGFNNIEKIEKIKIATLIFHGAKDEFTSIADAENLQSCCGARTKQFFIIPGASHNSLYESGGKLYFETIKKFIDTLCGVNTWRQQRRKYQEAKGK